MPTIQIPVGTSNFTEIIREHYYFIDKSGLIEELLKTQSTKVTLITRPRRFGKSLGMSMLNEFFDIRKDSRDLFAGLTIADNINLCKAWMNQYPTLFLTFKDVGGNTFENAYGLLETVIANAFNAHEYLLQSNRVNANDQSAFLRLSAGNARKKELQTSIALLIRMLYAHYGKPVILLLDEYDVPIAKASGNNGLKTDYYDQMMEVLYPLISTAIKDNEYLKFAVITGCLKIAKESIFTGTNNFVSDTITDTQLNEFFGFTQEEVNQLLADTGLCSHALEIKEWYDGYYFGNVNVYCPWDVMNHVKNLTLNPVKKPVSYWKNSSDNTIIRSFIDHTGPAVTKKFETLMAGKWITEKIEDNLTYRDLYSSESNLWSVLYLTGYLTQYHTDTPDMGLPQGYLALTIPNKEIMEIFESTVKTWFEQSTRHWDRKALFTAVWAGDSDSITSEMTKLLRKTISYHDYKEDFYHAFFAGIFAGAGYIVESNREHGEGRSDIVIQDYARDRVAVFEVKYSKFQEDLIKDCTKALTQMDIRMYAEEFEEEYSNVICYGISFYKKRCMVQIKE